MTDTSVLLDIAAKQERLEAEITNQSIREYPSGTSGTVTYDIPSGKTVRILAGTTLTVWTGSINGDGTLVNNGTIKYVPSGS